MSSKLDYKNAIDYLYSINPFKIKPGLARIQSVLTSFNNPQNSFKSVLVGGTNGKGSTVEMIASILQQAGYKTGVYTSPHLYNFEERIRINGVCIPCDTVTDVTLEVRAKVEENEDSLTFFEFVTVMAFLYFSTEDVDIAILEVGLGGRLDAVNIVSPLVSVITDVAIDHTDWLGNDIRQIAAEKAGIVKEKGILVSSCRDETARQVVEGFVVKKKSAASFFSTDFFVRDYKKTQHKEGTDAPHNSFSFCNKKTVIQDIFLPLPGKHFSVNASCAIETVLQLQQFEFLITNSHIKNGLCQIFLQGRIEQVGKNPVIVLDVAHNPHSIQALKEVLLDTFPYNRLIVVLGLLKDKEAPEIISIVSSIATKIILTKTNSPRAFDPDKISKMLSLSPEQYCNATSVFEAVEIASSFAKEDDMICITGSFSIVSSVRTIFMNGSSPLDSSLVFN